MHTCTVMTVFKLLYLIDLTIFSLEGVNIEWQRSRATQEIRRSS